MTQTTMRRGQEMAGEYIGAYVLADIGAGDIDAVRERLLHLPHVVLVHALIGPNDLIMYLEADGYIKFMDILDRDIRGLIDTGDLVRTETRLVLASRGKGYSKESNLPPQGAAWIFLELEVGDPQPVVEELLRMEGVVNAHAVLGACDIIAYVETEDWQDLMQILDDGIRRLQGVRRTDTRLVLMRRAKKLGGYDLASGRYSRDIGVREPE